MNDKTDKGPWLSCEMEPRLPTVSEDGYYLADAEMLARDHPASFEIPSAKRRYHLRTGMIAKLIFRLEQPMENGCNGERMWVIVEKISNGWFLGRLNNHPLYMTFLSVGHLLWFSPRHVIAIDEMKNGR